MVRVESTGPPWVMTKTWSKTWKLPMMPMTYTNSDRRPQARQRDVAERCQPPAPSTLAAS